MLGQTATPQPPRASKNARWTWPLITRRTCGLIVSSSARPARSASRQADLVEGRERGQHRRVVDRDDRRGLGRGGELGREPVEPLAVEPPVLVAGDERVADDQPQVADLDRVLKRRPGRARVAPGERRSTRAARRGRRGCRRSRTPAARAARAARGRARTRRRSGRSTRSPVTITASRAGRQRLDLLDRAAERVRRVAIAAADADVRVAELGEHREPRSPVPPPRFARTIRSSAATPRRVRPRPRSPSAPGALLTSRRRRLPVRSLGVPVDLAGVARPLGRSSRRGRGSEVRAGADVHRLRGLESLAGEHRPCAASST